MAPAGRTHLAWAVSAAVAVALPLRAAPATLPGPSYDCLIEPAQTVELGTPVTGMVEKVFVSGVEHAVGISVGAEQGCALLEGGGVRCWGRNSYGTLGSLANRDAPTYGDAQFVSHAPIGFVNYPGNGRLLRKASK